MNIFKMAWSLIFCVIFVVISALLFIFLVPLDFYVNMQGRAEPSESLRCSFPDGGVLFSLPAATFRKGDILAAADSGTERQKLEMIENERALLLKELEDKELQNQLHLSRFMLELERTQYHEAMQKEQLKTFTVFSENLSSQKKLDEALRKEEADVFENLYKKQLVAKLEFIKALHNKKMAELMSEQVHSQMEQSLFNYKLELYKLGIENKLKKGEKKYYENPLWKEAASAQIRKNLFQLDSEKASLKEKIRNKTIIAPFDGKVLFISKKKGEFVKAGELFMEIAASPEMCFTGTVDQAIRPELLIGQKAEIWLDNYSYPKYDSIGGILSGIQTILSEKETFYVLKISLDKTPYPIEPGYSGKARVIVFHGTVFRYILRKT
ncbi:MAG: hypothetical protein A2017_11290 [Lentisphaerae bacterium GWF2_44_16]|nr:MAG: hypothetical protein A2017_11290 [Lentisphaerae bacterium GWF2_44_16]